MTCEAYVQSLSATIAGDPAPAAVEHERACASCRNKRKSMEECLVAIAQLPRPAVPAQLGALAMAKIATVNAPWAKPPVATTVGAKAALGWAAAALMTAAVVVTATHRTPAPASKLLSHSGAVKDSNDAAGYHVQVPAAAHATVRLSADAVVELDGPAGLSVPPFGPPFVESGAAEVRVSGSDRAGLHLRTPHLEVTCQKGSYGVNVGTVSTVKAETAVEVDANGRRHHVNAGEEFKTTPPAALATGDAGPSPSVAATPARPGRPQGVQTEDFPPQHPVDAGVSGHPVDLPSSLQNLEQSGQRTDNSTRH